MKEKISSYLPGIGLFVLAVIVGFVTYKDYGMCWDEPAQRGPGVLSYDYIFHGSKELFRKASDNHGAGFELLLVFFEKWMKLTDPKAIYEMRHIVTHLLFLVSALSGYVLIQRLFRNNILSILTFLMLVLAPRIYAHSFFNSKDLPFLSMVIITLALCQIAFEKNKPVWFLLLGLACGYATSIRIMGIMIAGFVLFFLLIDLINNAKKKEKINAQLLGMVLFSIGFCFLLYISWPYLWKGPVKTFAESFGRMSHYDWMGGVLLQGQTLLSDKPLPWTYFPIWFFISNPPLWLLLGFGGVVMAVIAMVKNPLQFLQNTKERNLLLYLMCFAVPIFAVIVLKSVIYDDWRHLYFVYPAFVFLGIYGISKFIDGKYKLFIQIACGIQVALVAFFMVSNHPFSQVYINSFVSHEEEFIRKNYDMEYWGCSHKQALDYLTTTYPTGPIKVCVIYRTPLDNNIMMLPKDQRERIVFEKEATKADFFITNFRLHPDDFPSTNIEYEIQVLNSTIMRIYNMHPKQVGIPRQ